MPPLVLSHVFLFFLSSSNPRTRKGGTGICVPSPSGCFSRCACPTPSLSLSEEKVRPSRSLLRLGWERWNGTVIPVFIPGMDGRTHPFAWQRTDASIHPPVEWILLGNGTRREGDRTRTIPSGGDGSGFRVWKRTDSPFFFFSRPHERSMGWGSSKRPHGRPFEWKGCGWFMPFSRRPTADGSDAGFADSISCGTTSSTSVPSEVSSIETTLR